ncbi:ribosome silencing factor [bacterium]|nr:ribosome silencing factor [FCB group bacterium]MBL7191070.1 ribosome silencing factor [bacterium]
MQNNSEILADKIARLFLEKKAHDIIVMDLRSLTTMTDFFVIANGAVDIHLKALSDHLLSALREEKIKPLHVEGYNNLQWVLIDFVDVIAHLFLPEQRKYYNIERLWSEAEVKRYE